MSAKGKALVAKLRKDPEVRDADALAAWLGRRKAYKKMGVPSKMAGSLANSPGGKEGAKQFSESPAGKAARAQAGSQNKPSGSGRMRGLAARLVSERDSAEGREREQRRSSATSNRPRMVGGFDIDDDDDDMDYGPSESARQGPSAEQRYQDREIRAAQQRERGRAFRAIMEQGGLKTNTALSEEYRGIPNTYKRKDGMAGDEMADHLARFYPELGIESERDLIDFFAA